MKWMIVYVIFSVMLIILFDLLYEPRQLSVSEVLIAIFIGLYMLIFAPFVVASAIVMWVKQERNKNSSSKKDE